jgi:hypothetical protein
MVHGMIEGHAFFIHRADALAGRNDAEKIG